MKWKLHRPTKLIVTAAVTFALAGSPVWEKPAQAAVPKLDTIRVALYINADKYKVNTASVTLSADGGLTLGIRTAAGAAPLDTVTGPQAVKASLNGYTVKVLTTGDWAAAQAAGKSTAAAGQSSFIYKNESLGKPVYQVVAGPYVTLAEATAAKAALTSKPEMAAYSAGMSFGGTLYWNAGSFSSEAEALKQKSALAAAGVMTELVLQENAAVPVYSLWLGGESDAGQLEAVKGQALAAAPGLTLAPVDAAAPYLMKRTDVSASTNGASGLTHYSFNSNGEKVLVSPKQSKIQVKEKNRAYRGTIELSPFNGKLAVINELPFEEYLYSVVTSEMNTGWPKEALKAQAVAARTYAAKAGLKYQIAHVSDSVADQAYNGNEYADVTQAVEATRGEMLADKTGALITPYYSSNAGGMSSESSEVWNAGVPYLKSVPSPDERASKDKPVWYKLVRKDGAVGYVHPSYLKDTGTKNPAGLPVYQATEVVNVRSIPTTNQNNSVVLGQLAAAERVTILGSTPESTEYAWIRGPYKADVLLPKINAGLTSPLSGLLTRLETGARGPSNRVISLKVNGSEIKVPYADSFRTMLNGLPSTLFDIEETGRYTVLGANGTKQEITGRGPGTLNVLSAQGTSTPLQGDNLYMMDGGGKVRLATADAQFLFTGKGYGHGLGMSQWGARAMAEQGNDYRYILTYYYSGATIIKD